MSISESEQYDLLDQLAEEFAERYRRGERPTLEEYTDRYPDLADDIRELFPALAKVEQVEGDRQAEDVAVDSRAKNPPPPQIGDYRILREIGRGGMGVVYEAEQISLGRRVALKVLPGQASRDRVVQERFRREARAAAKLHHTNIVPVFEVGQDGDVRFYAMQFIQGLGLDAVIAELRHLLDRARSQSRNKAASGGRSPRPRWAHTRAGHRHPDPRRWGRGRRGRAVHPGRSVRPRRPGPGSGGSLTIDAGRGPRRGPRDAERARRSSGRIRLRVDVHRGRECDRGRRHRPTAGAFRPHPSCRASPSSTSAILPGGAQLSSVESGRRGFFRSLAQIGRQVAGGLAYAHAAGSSTATSSRRTCCWTPKAWSGSPISAWPRRTTKG